MLAANSNGAAAHGQLARSADAPGYAEARHGLAVLVHADCIASTRKEERALAPHPNLKPQAFLRQLVHGVLPLGEGIVLDPFCGAGSTLAAAEAVGYSSLGVEKDAHYFAMAREAIPRLAQYQRASQPADRQGFR